LILCRIQEQMTDINSINADSEDLNNPFDAVPRTAQDLGFLVPKDYFEGLSSRILDKIADQEIEETSALLAKLDKKESFPVPDGYFDELSVQILSQINIHTALGITVNQVNASPSETYFDELASEIENAVILEKLEMRKEVPFAVPSGYFEQLSAQILDKINEPIQIQTRFGKIRHMVVSNYWMPVSLAAACLLLITLRIIAPPDAGYSPLSNVALNETALNDTDKKEVIDNLELYGIDEAVVLEHVSSKSKPAENTEASSDKGAAIDYLIENNVDLNSITTDNPDNI